MPYELSHSLSGEILTLLSFMAKARVSASENVSLRQEQVFVSIFFFLDADLNVE